MTGLKKRPEIDVRDIYRLRETLDFMRLQLRMDDADKNNRVTKLITTLSDSMHKEWKKNQFKNAGF